MMTYEEWAATHDDPGTIDYLEYLGGLADEGDAEAKATYIKICLEDGIDLPDRWTNPQDARSKS